jgi:phosphatidylinositol dimannoside acyltransferase
MSTGAVRGGERTDRPGSRPTGSGAEQRREATDVRREKAGSGLSSRLRFAGLSALGGVLVRLPEDVVHGLAATVGLGYYLVAGERRALVRANLARTARGIVALGLADARTEAAARDPRALERLVRSAFGHYVRYYVEMLLIPRYDLPELVGRVAIDTPATVERAFKPGRGRIFLGLHLGAIELPGIYVVQRAGTPVTAPMETVGDPQLQAWLERIRGRTGVRIIPIRDARRRLREALGRNEVAGLIGDRDLVGTGLPVSLFGAPTTLPAGAGILAFETKAPVYAAAVRRTGPGRYAGQVIEIEAPSAGSLRPWVQAFVERQARAYEELIASAPDQWWTVFFPIWPDLGGDSDGVARRGGEASPDDDRVPTHA